MVEMILDLMIIGFNMRKLYLQKHSILTKYTKIVLFAE